jgi:hypothetical protein
MQRLLGNIKSANSKKEDPEKEKTGPKLAAPVGKTIFGGFLK